MGGLIQRIHRPRQPGPIKAVQRGRSQAGTIDLDDAIVSEELVEAGTEVAAAGFADLGETAGTPDGPVHVLRDPDGNELGLLQQDVPNALVARYADPTNDAAIRRGS